MVLLLSARVCGMNRAISSSVASQTFLHNVYFITLITCGVLTLFQMLLNNSAWKRKS